MEKLKENMFILYVRPHLKVDRAIIDRLPVDAPIYVQDVSKLPSIPSFLRGTPVLVEPRRSKTYEGSRCIEIVDLYLEFLKFHPYALLQSKKEVQAALPEPPNPLPPPPASIRAAAAVTAEDLHNAGAPQDIEPPFSPTSPQTITPLIPPRRKRATPNAKAII